MSVRAVTDLNPHLRRITFHAKEFADFERTGPDECFAMLMPPAGQDTLTLPDVERWNVRAAVQKLPEHQRPDLRWYTIRALRPEAAEIDVDVILHGDAGPGTRWASAAEPGRMVGFRAGSAAYRPVTGGVHLLAADEAALPALASILETAGNRPDDLRAYIEVPTEDFQVPIATDVPVTWLYRGDAEPGSALLPAIRAARLSTLDHAWVCGESALATGLRRHLIRDRSTDRRRIYFSGYWKRGKPRF